MNEFPCVEVLRLKEEFVRFLPKSLVRGARKLFLPDAVMHKGVTLPAEHLRFCGARFRDAEYFLASAHSEADRLIEHFGLTVRTCLLDVGCGVGRLPIGILSRIGEMEHYRGIDVSKESIEWCQRHISGSHQGFQFIHIDVRNARYNPRGEVQSRSFRFPFQDGEFGVIYLYSVFSHMETEDVGAYLKEFKRVLASSGRIFLTAFIEDDVPEVTVNPAGYRMVWSGPLQCVRYNRAFFEFLLSENNFAVDEFAYGKETDGQSGLYVSVKRCK